MYSNNANAISTVNDLVVSHIAKPEVIYRKGIRYNMNFESNRL